MRAIILAALCAAPASADTTAVLSSESRPYRDALEGMREALGSEEALTLRAAGEDSSADTVVAFGAKAAGAEHPQARTLIVALAPAYAPSGRETACTVVISVMPAPDAAVATLRRLQPNLTRLWVPWISPSFEPYMAGLVASAKASGIAVESARLGKTEELPARLRAREKEPTAILVPPDPEFVNRTTFGILKQVSRAGKTPLYAPFSSMISEGATASIGVTFHEMGRAAGLAARRAKDGLPCDATTYPERTDIRVSLSAAAEAGLPGDRAYYAAFAETEP
jgi:hypothetical protein